MLPLFKDYLKKKGTGTNMGKSLFKDDLDSLEPLFLDNAIPLASKATLLTALLMLKANPDEEVWLQKIKRAPSLYFPQELLFLFTKPKTEFETLIHKLLIHVDLMSEEMKTGMMHVCAPTTPPAQKAAFLEGERLKRETFIENRACFEYLYEHSKHLVTSQNVIVDIANPYDGFNRFPNLMLFVAPVLAALNIPVVLHGTYEVSPKKGITLHKLLHAANKDTTLTLDEACKHLDNIGWTYIDQPQFSPILHELNDLRTDMVKRPLLSTLEKFLCPLQGKEGNILITGFTHPPYKSMTENILKTIKPISGHIILRGTEGSTQLPPDRKAPFIATIHSKTTDLFSCPEDYGLIRHSRLEANKSLTTEETLALGLDALQNKPGVARDIIIYNASFILSHVKPLSMLTAMKKVSDVIENKSAYALWLN